MTYGFNNDNLKWNSVTEKTYLIDLLYGGVVTNKKINKIRSIKGFKNKKLEGERSFTIE